MSKLRCIEGIMDAGHDSKRRSMTMASDKEGQVLNADDLKLAEMGYKPVDDPLLPFSEKLTITGTCSRVFHDVCYGIGVQYHKVR